MGRTGALSLFDTPPAPLDSPYRKLHDAGKSQLRVQVLGHLSTNGPSRYEDVWTACLSLLHVRKTDVGDLIFRLREAGEVEVDGWDTRKQRRPKDAQVLRLPQT